MLYQERCKELSQTISEVFGLRIDLTTVGDNQWEFSAPFGDQHGDPLWLSVGCRGDEVTMDDGGAVAGLLFSLDQDEEGSPAFELMDSLTRRHNLVIDYDLGVIRRSCPLDKVADTLPVFTRVVLTILTASPHLEKRRRRRRSLGRRLRSRIRDSYKDWGIDHYVDQRSQIPGCVMSRWPADFHWQLGSEDRPQNVFVLAADLNIQDPLSKAHKVSSIALDTVDARARDDLRIVIDTHEGEHEVSQAARLIRQYESSLKYTVFDFADNSQRSSFFDQATTELLSEKAQEWRMSFAESDGLTEHQ